MDRRYGSRRWGLLALAVGLLLISCQVLQASQKNLIFTSAPSNFATGGQVKTPAASRPQVETPQAAMPQAETPQALPPDAQLPQIPVTGGQVPRPRMWASLLYHPGLKQAFLFGGGRLNDLWALDATSRSWKALQPANVPNIRRLGGVTAAYDARADQMILFIYTGPDLPGETWAYDFKTNAWRNLNPANPPVGRRFTSLVYDPAADKTLLFGGFLSEDESAPSAETWAYDSRANRWQQLHPSSSPPARGYLQAAFDTRLGQMVIWGGQPGDSSGDLPDSANGALWFYDSQANAWKKKLYQNGPRQDYDGALAYASDLDRLFLYVGDQFWSYDAASNHWERLSTTASPGRRFAVSLVYLPETHSLVLFGGTGDDNAAYAYDPEKGTWSVLVPGGSKSGPSVDVPGM